jgi:hypothetical protein
MEFGWASGSVGFVNEKMTFVIREVLVNMAGGIDPYLPF